MFVYLLLLPRGRSRSGLNEEIDWNGEPLSHGHAQALVEQADGCHRRVRAAQRELFGVIAELDRTEGWRAWGARDLAHWLWMRYGLSEWKARRWIACAAALEG